MKATAALYVSVMSSAPNDPAFLGPAYEVHLSEHGILTVYDDLNEPHTYAVEDITNLFVLPR